MAAEKWVQAALTRSACDLPAVFSPREDRISASELTGICEKAMRTWSGVKGVEEILFGGEGGGGGGGGGGSSG